MTTPAAKKSKSAKIVTHDEWIAARKELLLEEKALTRKKAEIAQKRQELPWELVNEDYVFETTQAGTKIKLSELCNEKALIVWHFMFSGGENGCKLCSFFLDGINGLYEHLLPRANFVAVAPAPPSDLAKLQAKKNWKFPLISSAENEFNRDFGVGFTQEQVDNDEAAYNYTSTWKYGPLAPGLSVFQKSADGSICHTYSAYAAGLADFNVTFALLDVLPQGRDESEKGNMWWVQQKEDYD